jgi:hypothetical protein
MTAARLIPPPDEPYAVTGPLEITDPDGQPLDALVARETATAAGWYRRAARPNPPPRHLEIIGRLA